LLLAVALFGAGQARAQPPEFPFEHPGLYLNSAEIAQIAKRIQREPEARAIYQALLEDCARHLKLKPAPPKGEFLPSPAGVLGDEGPEQPPPPHFLLARDQGGAARDLALAFALTGEKQYAEKAAELILAWASSLEPKIPRNYRGWYEMVRTIPAFLYAADLIYTSGAFSPEQLQQLRQWAGKLAKAEQAVHVRANALITAYSLNLVMCCGVVAEDRALVRWVNSAEENHDCYSYLIAELFEPSGEARKKYFRQPLRYVPSVLKGLALVAEAARHQGINLYDLEQGGRSLKKAFLFYAPYLDGTKPGPRSPFLGAGPDWSGYQLAASYWGDEAFAKVLAYHRRPAFDPDVLGPVSLTHPAKP